MRAVKRAHSLCPQTIARRAEILLGVKCVVEEDDAGGEAIDGVGGVWEVCVCACEAEKWRGVGDGECAEWRFEVAGNGGASGESCGECVGCGGVDGVETADGDDGDVATTKICNLCVAQRLADIA